MPCQPLNRWVLWYPTGAKSIFIKRRTSIWATSFNQGVTLIAKIKKSMKNCLLEIEDKLMLMRRSFIETIFSFLKSLNDLIHTRQHSVTNAFAHLLVGLIHYQLPSYKPSLNSIPFLIFLLKQNSGFLKFSTNHPIKNFLSIFRDKYYVVLTFLRAMIQMIWYCRHRRSPFFASSSPSILGDLHLM